MVSRKRVTVNSSELYTYSLHSVEIFSSLVLPRKILTRAPKFPVLGLFSTRERKNKRQKLYCQNYSIQTQNALIFFCYMFKLKTATLRHQQLKAESQLTEGFGEGNDSLF